MTESESAPERPPEEAADDVTVGSWLDLEHAPIEEPPSVVREPVPTPGLWERIKRALRAR